MIGLRLRDRMAMRDDGQRVPAALIRWPGHAFGGDAAAPPLRDEDRDCVYYDAMIRRDADLSLWRHALSIAQMHGSRLLRPAIGAGSMLPPVDVRRARYGRADDTLVEDDMAPLYRRACRPDDAPSTFHRANASVAAADKRAVRTTRLGH